MIGKLLSADSGTIRKHWEHFKDRQNLLRHAGRPSLLTSEELDEIVALTTDAYFERRPLSGPEIRDIIHRRHQKSPCLDSLY
jgi:hypothetical protein